MSNNSAHSFTEGADYHVIDNNIPIETGVLTTTTGFVSNLSEEQKQELKKEWMAQDTGAPVLQSMEEIQEHNRLEVERFKADPENKEKAFNLAVHIEAIVGTKWFTLPKLVKKTGEKPEALFQKLKLLELFDYCVIDKGDVLSKERGMWVFNITLNPDDKVAAIQRVINTHKKDIENLELKIKIIKAQQKQ